jgi:hypothetical protein
LSRISRAQIRRIARIWAISSKKSRWLTIEGHLVHDAGGGRPAAQAAQGGREASRNTEVWYVHHRLEGAVGGLRFDPSQTKDDLLQALERAAEAAWGGEALADLRASLKVTAQAIWLVSQEAFAPGDVEP